MDRVVIYSKDNCSYCAYAKNLLEQKKIPFQELKLNVDFSREQILELYQNVSNNYSRRILHRRLLTVSRKN